MNVFIFHWFSFENVVPYFPRRNLLHAYSHIKYTLHEKLFWSRSINFFVFIDTLCVLLWFINLSNCIGVEIISNWTSTVQFSIFNKLLIFQEYSLLIWNMFEVSLDFICIEISFYKSSSAHHCQKILPDNQHRRGKKCHKGF